MALEKNISVAKVPICFSDTYNIKIDACIKYIRSIHASHMITRSEARIGGANSREALILKIFLTGDANLRGAQIRRGRGALSM